MTERLAARIKDGINNTSRHGLNFNAFSIPDRGRGSLESRMGADLAGVLNVTAPGHRSRKLFLAQAKITEEGFVERGRLPHLIEQCQGMLAITEDSVVLTYSKGSVDVIRARDALQAASQQLAEGSGGLDSRELLYRKPLDVYMGEVYMTWQGDEKLGPEVRSLTDLGDVVTRTQSRRGLAIVAEAEGRSQA